MSSITQMNRLLHVQTCLGEDEFLLIHLSGHEGLSQNFRYELTLITENDSIDLDSLLGSAISFTLKHELDSMTYHGIIWSISYIESRFRGWHQYQVVVVPWFESLQLHQDSRRFYWQDPIKIFIEVFQQLGFHDFDLSKLQNSYKAIPYCVQYNETTLAFLQRILSEAGIFYYFTHANNQHVLTLADATSNLPVLAEQITYRSSCIQGAISYWRPKKHIQATNFVHNSTEFTDSSTSLLATARFSSNSEAHPNALANYHYSNVFADKHETQAIAKRTAIVSQWLANIIDAGSNIMRMRAGHLFQFHDERNYLVINTSFTAHDESGFSDSIPEKTERYYQNCIQCIASSIIYSPPILRADFPSGYMHAKVITANGKELDTDSYGRVKVQYLWERNASETNIISHLARVCLPLAGKHHGIQFIPRFGQEVIVGHLNGDLQQPIVLASVYNNNSQPLFNLPAPQNKSGIKTHTLDSQNSNLGNAIIFDDSAGSESLSLHAEKEFNGLIQQDINHTVTADEEINIGGNHLVKLNSGAMNLSAKEIHLVVGNSSIILNSHGINVKTAGGKIQMLAKSAGAIQPVARLGDQHKCPKHTAFVPHQGGPVLQGAANITANGLPLARINDPVHCKVETDMISTGINSITINGHALARLNDQTQHGGVIISASSNVLAGEAAALKVK